MTNADNLIALLVAAPLLGAAVLLCGGRRLDAVGHWIGTALAAASFVIGVILFADLLGRSPEDRTLTQHLFSWIPVEGFQADVGFQLDQLSMTFVLLITGVGSLIHLYSVGYMEHDERRRRFFGYLNLFLAAMLLLVLADNYLLLYVGWEGVGLASYLLIGFWQHKPSAATAAKKAFLVNRVGDMGLSIAIMLMFTTFGTFAFGPLLGTLEEPGLAGDATEGKLTAIALMLPGRRGDGDHLLRGHRRLPLLHLLRSHADPMYFLIGGFGDRAHAGSDENAATQRSYAAVKFLLYNLVGGLIMLAAVIGLYVVAGNFSLQEIADARANGSLDMATNTERWLFLGFFFAFAVKAPLWPLHTWLPNAMGEATAPVAVLITAVVDKVGTFAMLRFCLQLFPEASKWATPVILVLALISIIYGALLAVGQRDIKRLVAYASISHFGFIILGIFAISQQGQSGATLYMVNHGISTAALMLVAGFLISRRGSRLIADYGGVQKVAPVLAGTFLIGGLATLSLPGLAPFVSEFLVLVGTFARYPVIGIIATLGIVLAALYVLVLYQRTMTGPVKPEVAAMPDLRVRELVVVAPLVVLLISSAVYPKPVTNIVDPAVEQTMSDVQKKDPQPEVEAAK
ncbi:NAD(P)H-quinone oxidoreductase chain 4 [Streptomyces alboniger]